MCGVYLFGEVMGGATVMLCAMRGVYLFGEVIGGATASHTAADDAGFHILRDDATETTYTGL